MYEESTNVRKANSLEEFKSALRQHEVETSTKYILWKSSKAFSSEIGTLVVAPHMQIKWNGIVPYVYIGARTYLCHQGKDLNAAQKKRYAQLRDSETFTDQRRMKRQSKKVGCPARIRVTRIVSFPNETIPLITKSEKARTSKFIKDQLSKGEQLLGEEKYLFHLPDISEHQFHTMPGTKPQKRKRNESDSHLMEERSEALKQKQFPDLWKLAEEVELPSQVKESLLATGYDNIASLANIGNIKIIETFLRENHFLFQNSPQRVQCLYGIYESSPDKFQFLPGHVRCLQKLIKRCKEVVSKKRNANLKSNSFACSTLAQTKMVEADKQLGTSGVFASTLDVYSDLEMKINRWLDKEGTEQLEKQYEVLVRHKAPVDSLPADDNMSVELENLSASIVCLICGAHLQLYLRKNSFTIANATRHLARCLGLRIEKIQKGNAFQTPLSNSVQFPAIESVGTVENKVQKNNGSSASSSNCADDNLSYICP